MILELYNDKRKKQFDLEQKLKYEEEMKGYISKYLDDEYLWEFETLSMFLTNNPLKEVKDYVTDWNDISQGSEGVLLAVVVDLKRKKDKNNNVFAYIDLYTVNGIIESVAWSSIFKEYGELLQKGQCIALLGRKGDNNQMFIKKVKNFQVWLKDRKEILEREGELYFD